MNSDNYRDIEEAQTPFTATPADRQIMKDTSYYRVFDLRDGAGPPHHQSRYRRLVPSYRGRLTQNARFAVFSEVYYDRGWHALIDHRIEAPIIRTNYALRGLAIPPGAGHCWLHGVA